ncbi:MAG: SCO family protein [Cytophagales bacterium]|nr:MAG: SCO family protein [Cytophagales bacterium]
MKSSKYLKAGILLIALVVPALIFFNLKFFSHNHYKLPVFFAVDSVQIDGSKNYKVTQAHKIAEFSLWNQDSILINSNQFRDKILVVDFVFTRCQTICPKMTNELIRVQEEFENDSLVKLLSFTVDPEFDQPSVLRKHMTSKNVIYNKWTFLTGSKDSIYSLAQKSFFLTAMEDRERPLEFIHSDKVVLVDKNGWIRGYYNGTDRKEIDRLVAEIKVLQKIYELGE